ncbi:hypothetical protein MJO28_008368 [Puccinia striiformis f. sp. tritici]|uniref:Uncharacterized protein n=4 Tax=Puccinia striiformis TaxID=27350 RepID=A0A0L0VJA0_9BASI|nr:hypothetical protein Pst134EA_015546 [Puccinia striiformis f. sp. tritici]KAI9602708.1 hypothetical protein H4Q26_002004 [Puccinia striiformis f. sp. tritici PST-130]KNE99053.1 hypothetical protein PSTG_07705 [Puccinia striiformis f. sp. tritici PST-78]POW10008.1 hypothetical protein PSTT_06405 [Puccinia striiformis]KAH9452710.1 hypothetical protein Pst134EB_016663 [Puccinia striiformis f. sp. tritici]KAH9463463.1 hypothetical protein Pst134EA_015546 [Puccinia striiformis f. sp. tritici]
MKLHLDANIMKLHLVGLILFIRTILTYQVIAHPIFGNALSVSDLLGLRTHQCPRTFPPKSRIAEEIPPKCGHRVIVSTEPSPIDGGDPPFMKKTYDPILLTGLEDVPFEAPACPDKNRLLVEFDEIAKARLARLELIPRGGPKLNRLRNIRRYDPRDFLSPTILISDLHDLPHPGPQRAKLAANMEAHPKIAGINQDLSGVPVQLASHHK